MTIIEQTKNVFRRHPLLSVLLLFVLSIGFRLPFVLWEPGANLWLDTIELVDKSNASYLESSESRLGQPPMAFWLYDLLANNSEGRLQDGALWGLNLFLHALSAFLVYLTTTLLCLRKGLGHTYVPAIVATSVYLFLPSTLWFQGVIYGPETLAQVFFMGSVYASLKLWMRKKFVSLKYLFWYSILLLCFTLTSWFGFVFGLVVAIYSFYRWQRDRYYAHFVGVTMLTLLVSILLLVQGKYYQHGGIGFFDFMMQKLSQHNSLNRQAYLLGIPNNLGASLVNYIILLAPIIPLACTLSYFVVRNQGMKFVFTRNGLRFFGLAAWPIITLHGLLLSYSSQGFTSLYMAYFLSVLVGIFYHKLHNIKLLPLSISLLLLLLCLGISLGILQTLYV